MAERVEVPPHLGGGEKKAHVDEPVLDLLIERFGVRSMLDVGCGQGLMVQMARAKGLWVYGVDGDTRVSPDILWDFTEGPLPLSGRERDFFRSIDLVWSVEFVEHVEERYVPNFLPTLTCGRVLLMTHAPPGKAGHHHVNCQNGYYWVDRLFSWGFRLDQRATYHVRAASRMESFLANGVPLGGPGKAFIREHGLVFVNKERA